MDTMVEPGITLVNGRHLRLARIAAENIMEFEQEIRYLLSLGEDALKPVGTPNTVIKNCLEGKWQFFTVVENTTTPVAGMITELSERTNGRVLVLLWMGGSDMKALLKFFPRMEEWAKLAGCDIIEAWVRKGLTKILPEVGLEIEQYIMRRRIKK